MSILRKVLMGSLLIVAVTAGSASAGALIGSARIQDNTVGSADIRNGSLSGNEVRDGALRLADLTGLEPGVQGVPGPPGPPGADGVPGLQYRHEPRSLLPSQQVTVLSECAPEEESIAGGVSSTFPDRLVIRRSFPDGDHWSAEIVNESKETVTVYVWAVCIPE
jgi:hypothetical protein